MSRRPSRPSASNLTASALLSRAAFHSHLWKLAPFPTVPSPATVLAARSDLLRVVMEAGFGVLGSLLEQDRARLCGQRHARSEQRRAYRHGYDEGSLVLGGRRVKVRKPRARSVEGEELTLPHWETFKASDPLGDRALEQILCGATTRNYDRSLEPMPPGLASLGTSR